MSHAHSLVKRIGQLALSSASASSSSSASSSTVRAISTTAARSAEDASSTTLSSTPRTYNYSSPRNSTQFQRAPRDRAGARPRTNSFNTRERDDDDDNPRRRRGRVGNRRMADSSGRSGRRVGNRSKGTRESQADAINFEEDVSYAEWYHGPGSKAFAAAPKGRGPFWISRTPFPMNPSFDPPPPVSQEYKDALWNLHSKDPATYNMRFLSERFGLTLERTHAVLRLKALEVEMTHRATPLQLDFQENMERLMGSNASAPPYVQAPGKDDKQPARTENAHEPDLIPVRSGIAASLDSRGPLTEDVTNEDVHQTQSTSIILDAVSQEARRTRNKVLSTPTGGPDLKYLQHAEPQSEIAASARKPQRSVVKILDLKDARQEVNYKGEGHLDQNIRKADRRKRRFAASATRSKAARVAQRKGERWTDAVQKGGNVGTNSLKKSKRAEKKQVQSDLSRV